MIPVLYEHGETDFTTQGLGALVDMASCPVEEERNGVYEVAFEYPVTGRHFEDITEGRIILCSHDEGGDLQPFEIYAHSAPLEGVVTFNAHHISYMLSGVVCEPFTASSAAAALQAIPAHAMNTCPFTFWTDKNVTAEYKLDRPRTVRAILGGEENSLLDVYGKGEYEFDRFAVKLYVNRGSDKGVQLRRGKNLTDLTYDYSEESTYNAVVPYWYQEEAGLVFGGVVSRQGATEIHAIALDLTDRYQEKPTAAQLETAAEVYLNSNAPWTPEVSITVDFVSLRGSEEYASIAALETVKLCDTVTVIYPEIGVSVKAKVIKTVWDALNERYDSVEIGDPRGSFAQTLIDQAEKNMNSTLTLYAKVSELSEAIQHATELITGGLGGYIVFTLNADGQPTELLILDQPDVDTAVNVWRFNQNGLGHSSSGYAGPYDLAITADGKINASMILAGILSGNIVQGGTIQGAALETAEYTDGQGHVYKYVLNDEGLLCYLDGVVVSKLYRDETDLELESTSISLQGAVAIIGTLAVRGNLSIPTPYVLRTDAIETYSNDYVDMEGLSVNSFPINPQSGTIDARVTAGTDYTDYSVTFTTPYSYTPHVILTQLTGTNTQANVTIPVITSVSTTGFNLRVWRQAGTATTTNPSPTIYWLAI